MPSSRILVTGAAGYLGSRLILLLLESGYEVVGLDCLMFGGESLVSFYDHPRFRFIRWDIRDSRLDTSLFEGVHAIVHLAAVVGDAACSRIPDVAYAINTSSTKRLVTRSKEAGVQRFLFVSTASVYGVSNAGELANENSPLQALSIYAETKILAEQEVMSNATSGQTCTVLRLATLFGLSARMRFNLLVNELARSAAFRRKILIYAPDAWRPHLHVKDAARAIQVVLAADPTIIQGQIFNLVGENIQKSGLLEMVRRHTADADITIVPSSADKRDYRISASKADEQLGFKAGYSVEQGFLEMLAALSGGIFSNAFDPKYKIDLDMDVLANSE
jgi:nucleoside-diphosphate-sugar epimerase